MIILNSPENPTGSVLTRRDVEEICEIVREHDIWIFSDEIYSHNLYSGEYTSPYSFPDMPEKTIIMDGMSKAYAMTGWRLGYGVMPKELALQVTRLQINCTSCTAAFSQRAIIEALEGPQESVAAMAAEFKRRRDVIVKGLNAIPRLSCQNPDGAFYVFPNVSQIGWPSKKLADYLLEEAGVACLTGTSFGEFGEGYLRFSYANSIENIQEGLRRVQTALEKL
jgi:aspartate/methionine/tyrosine aminotransferase